MNKQSLQKKDKDGGMGSQSKASNSRDSPDTNAYASLAAAGRFLSLNSFTLISTTTNIIGEQTSLGAFFSSRVRASGAIKDR